MQKRVVGNINELNEASRKTASEKSANTAGADRGGCKANKTSFGRFKKFAVILMLLIVSVFCAIGSADWIISQQEQLPGGSGSTFVYDKKTLQNYIALKGSDETEAAAKVAEAEEYASLRTETDSDDSAVADKFIVKKAAVSKKSAVSTYANGLESAIYGKSAIYNGKPIVAIKKTAGIDNAAAELPDDVLNGSLLTSYKPLTDGSVTEADLTEAYFAEGATSGLPQNAGTYAILVKIKRLEAYGYAVKIFTILPCPVTVGWSGVDFANGFTYDGAAHPVTVAAKIASSDNGNIKGSEVNADLSVSIAKDGASVSEVKTAGDYTLAAVSGNDNYVIYDTEATRTTSFKVKQYGLDIEWSDTKLTYNKTVQQPKATIKNLIEGLIAPDVKVTTYISGNDTPISTSAVGEYIAKASVSDGNYSIASGGTTKFTISRIQVAIPTSGNNMLEYTGSQLTYTPVGFDENTMTITGNTGSYITEDAYKAVVSLKDPTTYEWSDKTTEPKTFAWYIVPTLVKFDGILEKTYEEAKTGITLDANVFTNLVFKKGEKANTQASEAASTIKVTDGNGNDYTKTSSNNVIKVGSTYKAEITLVTNYCFDIQVNENTNKCTFSRSGTTYIKYKTAKIGNSYYTIEDALAVSGDIILAGDSSSYVTTAFSNLKLSSSVDSAFSDYKSNYAYTLNEKTLTVPYDNNGTIPTSGDSGITEYGNVYAALIIHNNVKLTISSGNLVVSAEVGFNQSVSTTLVGKHGVIMNNGKIIVKSGEIKAYGYIKGGDSGLIELKAGTTTLDALSIYDWPGGRAGLSMCSSVFPTNAYTLHNISCPTKIYSGAIYKARVFLNAATDLDETIIVIGTSSNNNNKGMFNADDSSGYVLKSVTTNIADKNTDKDINCNITLSNQRDNDSAKVNHRDNIIVNGNYSDSPIKISKVIFTIQTSTSIPLPVGFMDITVNNGAKLTLTSSDYLLLPGSTLKVESGGILDLGSKVDIVAMPYSSMPTGGRGYLKYYTSATDGSGKHDGKLIINGTLTGSGYNLGGKILTESAGATLKVVNTSGSYITMTETSSPYYQSGTVNSTGNIMTGANSYANRSLGSGTFYSKIVDGEAVWYSETADILFNADGNIVSTIQKAVGANGYTIQSSDFPSTPTRDFYTFEDWYLDENCTVKALGQTIFASTTLYAGWTPVSYNITYKFIYNGNEITDGITNDKNRTSYTYEDSFFLNPATYLDEYKFYRWYTDSSLGSPITQITGMHGDLTLYGEFINKNDKTYNITYSYVNVNTDTEVSTPPATSSIKSNAVATFIPANFDSYNANTNKNKYFDGWYTDKSCTAEYKFTSLSEYIKGLEVSENTDVNITLYGKWVNKLELYIGLGDLEYKSGKYYYLQGTTLTLPDISKYEELTSLINFKEKYPSDKYKFLGFTSDPSGCTAEAVYKTDSNGYITEIETKVTIGDLSEIIANNGKLKVSADMREILAVDITMNVTATYTHKFPVIGTGNGKGSFIIDSIKISLNSLYSINNSDWVKSSETSINKKDDKTTNITIYIVKDLNTAITLQIANIGVEATKYLSSKTHYFNAPEAPTTKTNCTVYYTYSGSNEDGMSTFTINNITSNAIIKWDKALSHSD